jgi:aryl-alcohol dehydrogenase-like predicted oxidoreductase
MGCSRIGAIWQHRDDRTSLSAIRAALDQGITFFDTADSYGRGRSERILGRALRRDRGRVLIATKCGLIKTPSAISNVLMAELGSRKGTSNAERFRAATRSLRGGRAYSAAYVQRAVESSLHRLGTPYIDVLLLHSPPAGEIGRGDVVDALNRLQGEGRIRAWGISVRNEADALRALAVPGIGCLEVELNLCHPDAAREVIPGAAARGVGVIARQPFASGRMFRSGGHPPPGVSRRDVVAASLQFVLRTSGVATVIAGMTRPQHVEENVEAAAADIDDRGIERVRRLVCGSSWLSQGA